MLISARVGARIVYATAATCADVTARYAGRTPADDSRILCTAPTIRDTDFGEAALMHEPSIVGH